MEWDEIKKSITDDLMSRGLVDPSIRLRALEKIETIMRQYFPSYIENPYELNKIGKDKFKRQIWDKKGKGLNSAENSVINEIYYRISPEIHLRPNVRNNAQTYSVVNSSQKVTNKNGQIWRGVIVLIILSISLGKNCSSGNSGSSGEYWVYPNGFGEDVLLSIVGDDKQGYQLEFVSKSNKNERSVLTTPLIKQADKGRTIFWDRDVPEQYYILDKNGNLSAYDNYGFIETYRKYK
jgi:hypothetical protein